MTVQADNIETAIGTIGGTLLTFFAYVHTADVMKTAILAGVGAVVSFAVSMALRGFITWAKRRQRNRQE